MPGVANSRMKCPNLGALVPAKSLRPCAAIVTSFAPPSMPGGLKKVDRSLVDARRGIGVERQFGASQQSSQRVERVRFPNCLFKDGGVDHAHSPGLVAEA